jgi:hypothetical protein
LNIDCAINRLGPFSDTSQAKMLVNGQVHHILGALEPLTIVEYF